MSMKKSYTCNICKEEKENVKEMFGLHFINNNEFTLGGYGCTDNIHICYDCGRQLLIHLNAPEIKNSLGIIN